MCAHIVTFLPPRCPTAVARNTRRGREQSRTAPIWILRAAGHDHPPAVARIRLDVRDMAWAGVPCWSGGAQRWTRETVPAALRAPLRHSRAPLFMPGNPISLKTLVQVADARARYAEHRTGRGCRPTNATLAACAGVQRTHGATRINCTASAGRRDSKCCAAVNAAEASGWPSWRVGDRGRGWASVWVLHDDPHGGRHPILEDLFLLPSPQLKSYLLPRTAGTPTVAAPLRGAPARTQGAGWPANGSPTPKARPGHGDTAQRSPGRGSWRVPKHTAGPRAMSTS